MSNNYYIQSPQPFFMSFYLMFILSNICVTCYVLVDNRHFTILKFYSIVTQCWIIGISLYQQQIQFDFVVIHSLSHTLCFKIIKFSSMSGTGGGMENTKSHKWLKIQKVLFEKQNIFIIINFI